MTSFSKGLSPGLRTGVLAAPADVIGKALALRENTDVCPNTLTHAVMGELLHSGAYHRLLPRLCARYRTRRDALLAALERHLAGRARWTTARGGFFTWVALDAARDAEDLLRTAARSGVVFLPGSRFRRDEFLGDEKNRGERAELRLSCARLEPAEIEEGIGRLAGLL